MATPQDLSLSANARLGCQSMDNRGIAEDQAAPSPTLVFLHGFGGFAGQWRPLQLKMSYHAPTLAFDLPGHGDSQDYPGFGPPKRAAEAVLAELAARNIEKVIVVGHSMGGAVASLMALLEPSRLEKLILLAPGGFGEEFNHPNLMTWAAASTQAELQAIMPTFFADGFELPQKAITYQQELRARPGAVDALVKIGRGMSKNGKQGVLPLDSLAQSGVPIEVIWGLEDQILPVAHAKALKAPFQVTLLENVGHSPAEEAPDVVEEAILRSLAQR